MVVAIFITAVLSFILGFLLSHWILREEYKYCCNLWNELYGDCEEVKAPVTRPPITEDIYKSKPLTNRDINEWSK